MAEASQFKEDAQREIERYQDELAQKDREIEEQRSQLNMANLYNTQAQKNKELFATVMMNLARNIGSVDAGSRALTHEDVMNMARPPHELAQHDSEEPARKRLREE